MITIRTPGLSLPDPGASRETYTRAERVSVATLSLVAALALRLVSSNRSRHKIVLLDEAWFLLASSQGRLLLNRLIRLGRGMNATILVATQILDDLGDLSELFGSTSSSARTRSPVPNGRFGFSVSIPPTRLYARARPDTAKACA